MDNWFETLVSPFVFLLAGAVAVALAYGFRRRLDRLVREFRITKIGALGVNVEFAETRATDAYEKQGLGPPSADDLRKIREVAAHLAPLAAGRRVLWVDDNPSNNQIERATFRDWRIEVQTRRDTDDALDELRDHREPYDLVISDWARDGEPPEPDGAPAGLRLIERMRDENIAVPVLYYHGYVDRDELDRRRSAARDASALGATGSPGELFRLALLELARISLDE